MATVFEKVFTTRARSTHHKIALDALRHLRGDDADKWRDLFLLHHEAYLEGAKAPDTTFKDFMNHVLHVGENEWGGAIRAADKWYATMVEALRAKKWKDAAYAAGVTSHYFTDPHQPFHTGQTEEEGAIHRAVEWSFNKSYDTFQAILEDDLGGYPEVEPSAGDDWLAQLIRAGAVEAHASYHVVIDHYDFAAGRKDPPSGLDQEIRDRIAALVGLATVGWARVLERAFDEAAQAAPKTSLALKNIAITLDAPFQRMAARGDDRRARRAVGRTWKELKRTGKVIKNLQADDKAVRTKHAEEILGIPLKELNAQPLRKLGERHGAGAPARDSDARPRAERYTKPYARLAASANADQRAIVENVNLIWPDQDGAGAHVNVSGAGVAANAPHPELAVRFIEFMLEPTQQTLLANGSFEYPLRAGVPPAPVLDALGPFRDEEINLAEIGARQGVALRIFDDVRWP